MNVLSRVLRMRSRSDERGQALIEMAAVLPILLLVVLATLEFGIMFDHHLSLEYATREGARTGSALANAGGVGEDENADGVDDCTVIDRQIVAAVERVLTSPGSDIDLDRVSQIRIYKSLADGSETPGAVNVWDYNPGAGPVVDGAALDFTQTSVGWNACGRNNDNVNPDKLGVSLTYSYGFRTALAAFLGTVTISMQDRTVMTLNPL